MPLNLPRPFPAVRQASLSWRQANLLFFVCSIVQFLADGHVTAFTPVYLHDEFGLAEPDVAVWTGLLVVVAMATAFPLTPFIGVLAERFSHRGMVLRGYFTYAVALLVMAWAPVPAVLLITRVCIGLGAGTVGVILAAQTRLVPRRHIGQAIAVVQATAPIALSVGPPLGAVAIPFIGLRGLFLADGLALVVAGAALLLLMPEPAASPRKHSMLRRTGEVLRDVWTFKPIRWNFICAAALRGASAVVEAYLPVRITQVAADPAVAIGWILGISGAVTAAATWYVGRVMNRIDEVLIYTVTVFVTMLLTIGLAVVPWLWLVGLFAVLRAIPVAFSNTVLHGHSARVLPREQQTAVLGMSTMPRAFGAVLFTSIAAAVAGVAPGGALFVGVLSYGLATFTGFMLRRASKPSLVAEG
jgi:MFS family permease